MVATVNKYDSIDAASWVLLFGLALFFCGNAAYRMYEAYRVIGP